MCVQSMVMDHYSDKWGPMVPGWVLPSTPGTVGAPTYIPTPPAITPEEVAEFRRLLERAREYDKRNHEPDCELDDKRRALKAIAAALGIDIAFIDKSPQPTE